MAKTYILKKSDRPDEPTIDPVEEMHLIARRIGGIEGAIRKAKADRDMMVRLYVDRHNRDIVKLNTLLDNTKGALLVMLQEFPQRKLKHGWKTFCISKGRESVEFEDEDTAVADLEAQGPAGKACIRTQKEVDKNEFKVLSEKTDGPKLESIRVKRGGDSLSIREVKK